MLKKGIFASLIALALAFGGFATEAQAAPMWDTTGSWVIAFEYLGGTYPHDMTLSQDGLGNLTGNGGHPAGGPHVYTWVITSGEQDGSTIEFYADYTASADAVVPQTTMHVVGTIAPDGTMSGTWSDNYQGGLRTGTWTSTSGMASIIETYESAISGGGHIQDSKGKKIWTLSNDVGFMSPSGDEVGHLTLQRHIGGKLTCQFDTITNITVSGNTGEYNATGSCSNGTTPTVHVVIEDNGEPGAHVDMISVSGFIDWQDIDGGNLQVNGDVVNPNSDTYSMYADGSVSCAGADDLSDVDGSVTLTPTAGGVDFTINFNDAEPNRTYSVALSMEPNCASPTFYSGFTTDGAGAGTYSGFYALPSGTHNILVNTGTGAAGLSDPKHREISTTDAMVTIL